MNNNINHFEDDIEILDDFEDLPTNDLPKNNEETKKQVDETVLAQLSAFSNQRTYNNNYNHGGAYGYDQPRSEQPMFNEEPSVKNEPEIFEVEDVLETPKNEEIIPEVEDIFGQPAVSPDPVNEAPEPIFYEEPVASVNPEPVVEKPTSLEKTTEMLTIPELEKTAVYPSGVIQIEKNEPVDDSDKTTVKSTKALMFIIGLFVLLAIVIFVVLPLVNPI